MIRETQPIAMVCIGGMQGVEEEFHLFRTLLPGAPVFVLETTGGAAAWLAERYPSEVRVIDRDGQRRSRRSGSPDGSEYLYPLIMQEIVEDLAAG